MFLIIISVLLGALGQFFLKIGADQAGVNENLISYYMALLTNVFAWLGMTCYGISFILWFRILTDNDLSFARPLVGMGYILSAFLACMFLGEKVTLLRWTGILLIVGGVACIGFSAK
jgi:drug/metabolite transporter (DMT)-like permease